MILPVFDSCDKQRPIQKTYASIHRTERQAIGNSLRTDDELTSIWR